MTNNKYFVIEKTKYSYPDEHFNYSIMKNKSFYLQNVDLIMGDNEQPLVLTEEMEVKQ